MSLKRLGGVTEGKKMYGGIMVAEVPLKPDPKDLMTNQAYCMQNQSDRPPGADLGA